MMLRPWGCSYYVQDYCALFSMYSRRLIIFMVIICLPVSWRFGGGRGCSMGSISLRESAHVLFHLPQPPPTPPNAAEGTTTPTMSTASLRQPLHTEKLINNKIAPPPLCRRPPHRLIINWAENNSPLPSPSRDLLIN